MPDEIKNALENISAKVTDAVQASETKILDQVKASLDENSKDVENKLNEIENKVETLNFTMHDNAEDDPKAGYKNHVEYLNDVMEAGKTGVASDRLNKAHKILSIKNAVGSDEQNVSSNPDGGFLIPEFTVPGVVTRDPQKLQGDLGQYTRRIPMSTSNIKLNARVDENHSTSVTGGIVVGRRSEMAQITANKMQFQQVSLETSELVGMAFATHQLLQDSPISFMSLINDAFGAEHIAKLNYERLWGTGAGEFEGVYTSPAKLTVARATASKISGEDILGMVMKCWDYDNAYWVANQNTLLQLTNAHIALSNTDVQGLYDAKTKTLFGRPVLFNENASTLGTAGDLGLINFNEYLEGTRGGIEYASSIHLRFDYAETAFRTIQENAGSSWWKTYLTPKNGSTMSPIVQLTDAP